MPGLIHSLLKRRSAALLLLFWCGLFLACERKGQQPQEPDSARETRTTVAGEPREAEVPLADLPPFTVPKLSASDQRGMAMLLEMRISSAYTEANNSPADPIKLGHLAALYYVHGFPDQAAQCFERCAQLKPDAQGWWYSLGLAHEKAGHRAKAIAALEKAITLGEDYAPAYVRLANLVLADDPDRAGQLYQQGIDLDRVNPQAYCGLGRVASAQGRHDEALKHFRRAVGLAPQYADAQRATAETLQALGRPAEADAHLRWAEAGGPPPAGNDAGLGALLRGGLDPQALCSSALALALRDRLPQAESLVRQALDIGTNDGVARKALGDLLSMQRRYDEAAAEYQRALAADPEAWRAKSALGQMYAETGQTDQAERLLREVLAQHPDDAETLQRFVNLMNRIGRPDEPLRVVQLALESDPRNASLHFRLAQLLGGAKREAEAQTHLRKAVVLRPELVAARRLLALALSEQGDLAGAKAEWEQVLQVNPKSQEAYLSLMSLESTEKGLSAAEPIVRRGLEEFPDAVILGNALAWILAASPDPSRRNGEEAVKWAEKACATMREQMSESPTREEVEALARYLDTLGVAYAEAGRFEDALRVARQAAGLAQQVQATSFPQYLERIALYEQNKPYHEPE